MRQFSSKSDNKKPVVQNDEANEIELSSDEKQTMQEMEKLLSTDNLKESLDVFNLESSLSVEDKEELFEKYDKDLIEAILYFGKHGDSEQSGLQLVHSGLDRAGISDQQLKEIMEDEEDNDPLTAKKHFLAIKSAADAGVDEALYECGACHLHGRGTPINEEEAARYFKKAAESGLGRGQATWGLLCLTGQCGVAVDYTQAASYLQKASEQGVAEGHSGLAHCYMYGQGVVRDDAKALALHLQAAAEPAEVPESLHALGYMYGNGLGVEQSDEKALEYFELAAEKGMEEASYMAGMLLGLGRGREVNEETEMQMMLHFQQAANQGHAPALCASGLMMLATEEGRTPEMLREGFTRVKRAADLGLAKAQYCVGMMRLGIVHEEGVRVDHKEGLMYTRKAADQGHKSALMYFEHIEKHNKQQQNKK